MATGGNGSDELVNFKCCICAKKKIIREAERYCIECQDYYCTTCTNLHKMFPSAIGEHQFLDKSNFSTAGTQTVLPSFPVERCNVHKAKLLDMYCADHDDIVCATYVALNHRTCKSIHSVPDEVDRLYEKSAAEETKGVLLVTKTKMEDVKNAKEHLILELDQYKEKAAESIKQCRKETEAVLDKLESESIRNLEEEYRKIKVSLKDGIELAEKYITELHISSEKLSKSFGNKAQEFVSVKIARKAISKTKESEHHLMKAVKVETVLTADSKLKAVLKELKTFELVSACAIDMLKDALYEVKTKKQISIRHAIDWYTCDIIQGSCFTQDGLLLLTDYNNKRLKRADLSLESVKDHLDLEASPYTVCQIGNDEIAITLANKRIQFVSLGNTMTSIKQLKLDHLCRGLAYKGNTLFITDGKTTLYIYDMNGTMLHKITTDQLGNALFSDNRRISLSNTGDMIYVADLSKGLIALNLQGNYESMITDPSVVQPCGVCTDERGNMFICGWGESNIVQMNERTNKKLGVIGKVTNSRSVCFDPEQQKLVVTLNGTNTIDKYELE